MNSHSAAQFKRNKGIVTGLSRTSIDYSAPLKYPLFPQSINKQIINRKKMTNLSYKHTLGDDLEEERKDGQLSHFARNHSPVESKGYIEDIGSVQALFGSVRAIYCYNLKRAFF